MTNLDLKTLATSPAFYMGCQHIEEAATEQDGDAAVAAFQAPHGWGS